MTDRHDAETEEKTGEGNARGSDIRFLKEKQRKGPGTLILAVLLLVVGIVYAFYARSTMAPPQPTGEVLSESQSAAMLVDRLWIDRVPEDPMDKFNFYAFFSDPSLNNLALNDQAQSMYRHMFELFNFRATKGDLQFQFPHDRRKGRSGYVIEKLPKPDKNDIDLKLTLAADPQNGNQSKVYYSATSWGSGLDRSKLPPMLQHLPDFPHAVPQAQQ